MRFKTKSAFVLSSVAIFAILFSSLASAQELIPPSDVENISLTPSDGSIHVKWDEASDEDGVVIGYKVYYGTSSVQKITDFYDDDIFVPAKTEFTLKNLTNGVKYFIAVTALDDEENESENYSIELSATPEKTISDSPKVISVEQISNFEIAITMSEPINPSSIADNFILTNLDDDTPVEIESIISQDEIILIRALENFNPGANYQVLATSAVEDLDGNPVASGITDTVQFVAKEIKQEVESDDPQNSPENDDSVQRGMEKGAYLPENPFKNKSEVNDESQGKNQEEDLTPPADAKQLKIDFSALESEKFVILRWQKSTDDDLSDQILYVREDGEKFDSGFRIGKNTQELELEVALDKNYEIKITSIDNSENESDGITTQFSTTLARTGPASSTPIVVGLAVILAIAVLRRRRIAVA